MLMDPQLETDKLPPVNFLNGKLSVWQDLKCCVCSDVQTASDQKLLKTL